MTVNVAQTKPEKKPQYRVTVETNQETGEIASVYFQFCRHAVLGVSEFARGTAFAYYGRKSKLVALELRAPINVSLLAGIGASKAAVDFVLNAAPRQMLIE